jgi:Domain of unknown function (DUF4386)
MVISKDRDEATVRPPSAAPDGQRAMQSGASVRTASLTAGAGLLLMAALSVFGNFVAIAGLVTKGDAARTAKDITASESLFRLGILSMLIVVALDVVVACALYRVFSPVSKSGSMLAAALRLAYAGVFMVAIGQLLGVLRLLGNDGYLSVFGSDQLHAEALLGINAFTDLWHASLLLFHLHLHLLVIGYLAYRSNYVPKFLSVLVAIAGLGYATDTVGAVLSRGTWTGVSSFTFRAPIDPGGWYRSPFSSRPVHGRLLRWRSPRGDR